MKIYVIMQDGPYGYQTPVKAFVNKEAADKFAAKLTSDNARCPAEVVEIELDGQ